MLTWFGLLGFRPYFFSGVLLSEHHHLIASRRNTAKYWGSWSKKMPMSEQVGTSGNKSEHAVCAVNLSGKNI